MYFPATLNTISPTHLAFAQGSFNVALCIFNIPITAILFLLIPYIFIPLASFPFIPQYSMLGLVCLTFMQEDIVVYNLGGHRHQCHSDFQ